jgi:hypothetical protein
MSWPMAPTGWGISSGADEAPENGLPTSAKATPASTAPVRPISACRPATTAPMARMVRASPAALAAQSPPTTSSQLCSTRLAVRPPSTEAVASTTKRDANPVARRIVSRPAMLPAITSGSTDEGSAVLAAS